MKLRQTFRKAKYLERNMLVKISVNPGRGEYRKIFQVLFDSERVRGIDIEKVYVVVRDYGYGLLMEGFNKEQLVKVKLHPNTRIHASK